MLEESPEKQINISESSEKTKENITSQVLDLDLKVDGKTLYELPGLLKWTHDINKKDENYSPKASGELLPGIVRGIVTERISQLVELKEGEVVVPKKGTLRNYLSECEIISAFDPRIPTLGVSNSEMRNKNEPTELKEGWWQGSKPGILQAATRATVDIPKEVSEKDSSQYILEVVQGYGGSKPGSTGKSEISGAEAGLYYSQTAIPDSFLINRENEFVGVVETKAYSPEEFSLYVKKAAEQGSFEVQISDEDYNQALMTETEHYGGTIRLGFDIEGQQKMLDILRDAHNQLDPLENMGIVILRIPADVSETDISEFDDLCHDFGYDNVVVQKLPFSFEEIDQIGKEAVRKIGNGFREAKKFKFADRELKVLSEYSGVELVKPNG